VSRPKEPNSFIVQVGIIPCSLAKDGDEVGGVRLITEASNKLSSDSVVESVFDRPRYLLSGVAPGSQHLILDRDKPEV
jgi:hypothetical protein